MEFGKKLDFLFINSDYTGLAPSFGFGMNQKEWMALYSVSELP